MQPDDAVSQGNDKGLVPDQGLRAKHGVSQAELLSLPRVEVIKSLPFEIQLLEELFLAGLAQKGHQLGVDVKMVFDRGLARSGNEEQTADARQGQLLHDVFPHRLTADRQHVFRLTLGGRQEPRPKACYGDHGKIDWHDAFLSLVENQTYRRVLLPK